MASVSSRPAPSTRGGFYSGDLSTAFLDHQESYLRGVFNFVGITDITLIQAEGLGITPESRESALATAMTEVEKLAA